MEHGRAEDEDRRVPHVKVGGVDVATIDEKEFLQAMLDDCRPDTALKTPVTVLDCNGQALSLAATDADFADALERADLIHADGQFIVWSSRIGEGDAIPERTATTDFIHAAARAAAEQGLSFYLLGGPEDVNAQCAEVLVRDYPGLEIAGRRNGFFDDDDIQGIIGNINQSGADILWVGLGKPKEQIFAVTYRDQLTCRWIVTCGGCFNFVTGGYSRAPVWMQHAGLEWFHRMFTGPVYLIPRYLKTIPHAIWLVLWYGLKRTEGVRPPRGRG